MLSVIDMASGIFHSVDVDRVKSYKEKVGTLTSFMLEVTV